MKISKCVNKYADKLNFIIRISAYGTWLVRYDYGMVQAVATSYRVAGVF